MADDASGQKPDGEKKGKKSKKSSKKPAAAAPPADLQPPAPVAPPEPKAPPGEDTTKKSKKSKKSSSSSAAAAVAADERPPPPAAAAEPLQAAADAEEAMKKKKEAKKAQRAAQKKREADAMQREIEERAQREKEDEEMKDAARRAAEKKAAGGDDDDGYGDDFEDYGDDFEDDEDVASKSSRAVMDAMNRENELARERRTSRESTPEGGRDSRPKSADLASNFGTFKVVQRGSAPKAAAPAKSEAKPEAPEAPGAKGVSMGIKMGDLNRLDPRAKRVKKIRDKIGSSLVAEKFDLFNQAPLAPYDLYLHEVRSGVKAHATVQTHEDDRTIEVQTDEVETQEVTMQFPEDIGLGDHGAAAGGALALDRFLQRATQAMEVVLEENLSKGGMRYASGKGDEVTQLGPSECRPALALLRGREILDLRFSCVSAHQLLTVHSPVSGKVAEDSSDWGAAGKSVGASWAQKSLLCVWDLTDPSRPHKVLTCDATPSCSALSPVSSHIVVCGSQEGSVIVWDLREPKVMHCSQASQDAGVPDGVRAPTYCTDGLHDGGLGINAHNSPVQWVQVQGARSGGSEKGSFPMASLDETGNLMMWAAIEIYMSDPAGSEADLQLGIGGRVKLVKGACITMSMLLRGVSMSAAENRENRRGGNQDQDELGVTRPATSAGIGDAAASSSLTSSRRGKQGRAGGGDGGGGPGQGARTACFFPGEHNNFLVGTDSGVVLHGCRFGKLAPPRVFELAFTVADGGAAAAVTAIEFSPFREKFFLVGRANGEVCLYKASIAQPLLSWDPNVMGGGSDAVVEVKWSTSRPAVFFVLDAAGGTHAFDLLEDDTAPTPYKFPDWAAAGGRGFRGSLRAMGISGGRLMTRQVRHATQLRGAARAERAARAAPAAPRPACAPRRLRLRRSHAQFPGVLAVLFARFSTMPAAALPRPTKAIQGIIDGIAAHGLDYDTDKVMALPRPPAITLFGGPHARGDLGAPFPRQKIRPVNVYHVRSPGDKDFPTSRSTSTAVVSSLLLCARK
jgi:hypothetical protein